MQVQEKDSDAEPQGSNQEKLMCKDGAGRWPWWAPHQNRKSHWFYSRSEPQHLGLGVGWRILLGHSLTRELKTVFLALMQEVFIGSKSFLPFECLPLELPTNDH